eukprot:TRINITY_DN2065_c0_g1_i11.p1 TRINITY_DN2065_c0_g1~~TRINITY_DN2065_c0_g1_i11.p1  ORF type:complete len:277 (+),score=16.38 TRINITY_DN2065_c0_g1_i11:98-928(+)
MTNMQTPLEVEITIRGAKDLKNVNWRHGDLQPYAVVWIDPVMKLSTNVDRTGDTEPLWNEKLILPIPFGTSFKDGEVRIDIVHENPEDNTKPLVGSAHLYLGDILEESGGIGEVVEKKLKLKRPSGRPQGKLEVAVRIKEKLPESYYPPPPAYGYTPQAPYADRGYPAHSPYGERGYAGYQPYVNAPEGYAYQAPPVTQVNTGGQYYEGSSGDSHNKKSSKYGLGTGLAVGAVAGVLGGLAISEGVDYVEDKFDEKVDEGVEEALEEQGYEDGGED